MPRKPLTTEQTNAAVEAGGWQCPRCGNDDTGEMEAGQMESGADGETSFALDCVECQERWVVVLRAVRIESEYRAQADIKGGSK